MKLKTSILIFKIKKGKLKSNGRSIIIIHKSSSIIRTKIKNFLECLSYLMCNFEEVNQDLNFYQTKEIFCADYYLDSKKIVGLSATEENDPQIEFILKAFVAFVNSNKTQLKAFSKLFPIMMTLFFNPEIYYNDYQNDKFIINFVEVLPKIMMGGMFYYSLMFFIVFFL